MNEEKINSLVVVEQLPKITQQLQLISDEIDKNISMALSLECNEESKQEVKKARADLNKMKSILENRRKEIKNAVSKPYEEFEEVYKELVSNKLNYADSTLKSRIEEIELEQKYQKEKEIEEFANEQIKFYNIEEYITYKRMYINVTLSSSIKSLKDKVVELCKSIEKDLKMIELEEFKDEILVEYKNNLDFSESKLNVLERHKQLDEIKKKKEEQEKTKQEEQKIEKIVEENIIIENPVEIKEEELLTIAFTVKGTKEQMKMLKQFLIENNIEYR